MTPLPRFADFVLLPLINLALAAVFAGLLVVALGENPFEAAELMVYGAFGYPEAIGYTLYYTTNFVFTGLAVAVAFHCGLFNIGGEGQALIGGLGAALVALYLGPALPALIVVPLAILAAGLFGGFWGFVPGWLQARRGSHIVITTIMFNFIASAVLTYLLVNVLIKEGQASPETETFVPSAWMPRINDLFALIGVETGRSPLNLSLLIALVACVLVWLFVWRTRTGYAIRVTGQNERAAVYGGIDPARTIMLAMFVSGALAGFVALNEVMGGQHRLTLGFSGGYGFVGIAVALMGRNHPVGIVLAALLFGVLYQGGSELAFDMPAISRDYIVVIQGLVILFTGALENMARPALSRALGTRSPRGTKAVAREA